MCSLELIVSKEEFDAFECQPYVRNDGLRPKRATYRSFGTASNIYVHFKGKNPTIYATFQLLYDPRKHNKRRCLPQQGDFQKSFT